MKRCPVGLVGAGRSRNGLGPFLAGFLESEGFLVTGVSGRSPERATANASDLGMRLGHAVSAFPSVTALCDSDIQALVICSPTEHHLEALEAAARAGVATLCEKPLVHEDDCDKGARIIELFGASRIPLVENCQWPHVLTAFTELYGPLRPGRSTTVEMGLGPQRRGREMVQGMLPHLLSVIQATGTVDSEAAVDDVLLDDPSLERSRNVLRFRLVGPRKTVDAALHLKICTRTPRPAWLAINGRRMDRRIGADYQMFFAANGHEVSISDPTSQLVGRFARLTSERDLTVMEVEREQVRVRLQWYRQILERLP